jgi:hypothetical protein
MTVVPTLAFFSRIREDPAARPAYAAVHARRDAALPERV